MAKKIVRRVGKRAVPIIQVQVVVFMKIISYINIRVTILIDIRDSQSKTISQGTADNIGILCYVGKGITIISIQSISPLLILTLSQHFGLSIRIFTVEGVVHLKQIEPAIIVVI